MMPEEKYELSETAIRFCVASDTQECTNNQKCIMCLFDSLMLHRILVQHLRLLTWKACLCVAIVCDLAGATPLLVRMTRDDPARSQFFWSALAAFKSRTAYANTCECPLSCLTTWHLSRRHVPYAKQDVSCCTVHVACPYSFQGHELSFTSTRASMGSDLYCCTAVLPYCCRQ